MTAPAAPPPSASSPRQLPLSRLGHLVPPLVEGQALVALVPTTADFEWAAKVAWDIARIAARGGRRVALVDLVIEEPSLHRTVGLAATDGIVDAFEYGVSLNTAAQAVDGVYFIAAGSYTASPGDLYAHQRWRRLQAGFRSEGALLLLFLSPSALGRLSAVADGAIVLAPEGFDPSSAAGAEVAAALERGTVLLGVARDRWMPSTDPHFSDPGGPVAPRPQAPASRRRRGRGAAVLTLALAGAGAAGWALFGRQAVPSPITPTSPTPSPAAPAPAPATHTVPADTLAWTIQLAAYGSLGSALDHADRIAGNGAAPSTPVLVAPVPRSGTAVWYRVLAGSYATREAAAAGRDSLWRSGAAPRGIGDLLRAPFSFSLPAGISRDTLRARGLPAARGTLLGAFETPEQAAYTAALLARAGVRAPLLPRLGTTP